MIQEKPRDQFVEAASIMALIHNVITRGLNSIYKQAPHVAPEDYKDFIGYASCWYQIIESKLGKDLLLTISTSTS